MAPEGQFALSGPPSFSVFSVLKFLSYPHAPPLPVEKQNISPQPIYAVSFSHSLTRAPSTFSLKPPRQNMDRAHHDNAPELPQGDSVIPAPGPGRRERMTAPLVAWPPPDRRDPRRRIKFGGGQASKNKESMMKGINGIVVQPPEADLFRTGGDPAIPLGSGLNYVHQMKIAARMTVALKFLASLS